MKSNENTISETNNKNYIFSKNIIVNEVEIHNSKVHS